MINGKIYQAFIEEDEPWSQSSVGEDLRQCESKCETVNHYGIIHHSLWGQNQNEFFLFNLDINKIMILKIFTLYYKSKIIILFLYNIISLILLFYYVRITFIVIQQK